MEQIVKELRNEYKRIEKNLQEDNLRLHIIINTFMEYYGYSVKDCIIEKSMGKGFCDLFIPVTENEVLIIEVKNGKKPLCVKDIEQVQKYAAIKKQRFAILSNGYEYVLLDFDIKPMPRLEGDVLESYVVFWFNILEPRKKGMTELKYFKYLKCENLYQNKSTHFYCDIAQYKVWKCEQGVKDVSWTAYRCTLYQFFAFYSTKKPYKTIYDSEGRISYESLNMEDFRDFIVSCKRNGDSSSKKTIENNYTHIYDMLYELKQHRRINYITLSDSRKFNLKDYDLTEQKKEFTVIQAKDIQKILGFLENRRNANRNIVVFLLTVSLGLERSQLLELTWDSFDKNYNYIMLDGRKIELPALLQKYLSKLYIESKEKKIKPSYVFQTLYKGNYKQMEAWGINDIFDKFADITNDDKWKDYSPKYVRNCLIVSMFESGYSLEDIIYITGIDIKNISQYISMDKILSKKNRTIKWDKLFEGMLCATV